MTSQAQFLHRRVGDFYSLFIPLMYHSCSDLQARLRLGGANTTQHSRERTQWGGGPICTDETEQMVFDRVPLGSSSRIVANGHLQSVTVGQLLLQANLPKSRTTTI